VKLKIHNIPRPPLPPEFALVSSTFSAELDSGIRSKRRWGKLLADRSGPES
jgi:hypothetical protein